MHETKKKFNHKQLVALMLVPTMLMVLDLPRFKGYPQYEVPTRPHTVWCMSIIQYDGLVAIILNIFFNSWLSAHDSGSLSLRKMRFVCLMTAYCNLCLNSFITEGEGESESHVERT